jgi:hypothetical protein
VYIGKKVEGGVPCGSNMNIIEEVKSGGLPEDLP